MSYLTEQQIQDAVLYNQANCYKQSTAYEIGSFWLEHTPRGKDVSYSEGIDPNEQHSVFDDDSFIVYVLACEGGVQDFLYSDPGDNALGVPSYPATKEERDGKFGSGTYRRMQTYLESLEPIVEEEPLQGTDAIIVGGEKVSVSGVNVVTFDDPDGLSITKDSKKGYRKWGLERKFANHITMIHWDVCFSAKSCFRVLTKRGYASCFGVDNPSKKDGTVTVYQWLDPGIYRAVHGGKWPNKRCLSSVDLSNAVSIKYASRYEKMVGIPRPIIRGDRNNGTSNLLGMYKGQLIAWLRIERELAKLWGMDIKVATGRKGKPDFYPSSQKAPLVSWVTGDGVTVRTHLEYTAKKWDVAGLYQQYIALYLMDSDFRDEFPWLKENFKLEESFWSDWLDDIKNEWTWSEIGI